MTLIDDSRQCNMRPHGLLVVALCLHVVGADTNDCPRFCNCYEWNGLRRADCINQRLVNIETDMPTRVQVFDLSNNYITSLHNRGFQDLGLVHVKYLNFQHNKISSVGLYAFEGLKELQLIDLSDNHLQYLHPKTFEGNSALRGLYLGRNKLGRPLSGAFLYIPLLRELDLSRCQFGDMNDAFFSELQSLKKLNLSDNQLIRVNVEAFSSMKNLQELDLSLNPWPCDEETAMMVRWIQSQGIRDTTHCEQDRKLANIIALAPAEPETEEMDEIVWSDIKEMDREVEIESATNAPDGIPIPSVWALTIGFEVGVVLSVFAMYIWLQAPNRLKRSNSDLWTELESPICPDTPPPPYHSRII